jgi:hypothetical protein
MSAQELVGSREKRKWSYKKPTKSQPLSRRFSIPKPELVVFWLNLYQPNAIQRLRLSTILKNEIAAIRSAEDLQDVETVVFAIPSLCRCRIAVLDTDDQFVASQMHEAPVEQGVERRVMASSGAPSRF